MKSTKSSKKVVFSINGSVNHCGVDEYTLLLEKTLMDQYEFIHIVKPQSDIYRLLKERNSKILTLSSSYIKSLKEISEYKKTYNPEIVLINTAREYYLSLAFSKDVNIIIVRHNSYKLNQIPNFLFLKKASFIIAPSGFCANVIRIQFPGLKDRIKVVYNVVDIPFSARRNDRGNREYDKENRNNDNSEKDKIFKIGFIGRIEPKKGLNLLIDSLYYLKSEDLNFHCYIAGKFCNSEYEKEVLDRITIKKLKNNITFEGFIKDKKSFYGKLDLLVVPSLKEVKETFGLVLLESMAFGVPMVVNASGALAEILSYGPSSMVCFTENPSDLARVIKLMLNQKLSDEYKKRISIVYNSFFNFDRFKNEVKNII